jgi:ATP phosphoribosyltransferase
MTVSMSSSPLLIAVPSKGRLQENAFAFFARAGLTLSQSRGARDYRGSIAGLSGVEVLFLSASEIARELASGGAHFGITGEDLIRESIPDADQKLDLLTPLGFGHANVVVAVPQAWIDVRTMADLEDVASAFRLRHGRKMRVATKYINLTRTYFAEHGVTDYRIVESLGATEGAPASGAAELIVDITTTGATLQANALKVLEDGVMLKSEANLVASLAADWNETSLNAARTILARIAAEEEARTHRMVRASFARVPKSLAERAKTRFGVTVLADHGEEIAFHAKKKVIFDLSEWLVAEGAFTVSVNEADYVFTASNGLIERLEKRLGILT